MAVVVAFAALWTASAIDWGKKELANEQNGRSGKSVALPDNTHVGHIRCPTYRYILFRKSP